MINRYIIPVLVFSLALSLLSLVTGCQEELPDADISQFNRPQDIALICYSSEEGVGSVPLSNCNDKKDANLHLVAFITQTTFGEVAIVELTNDKKTIIDQDFKIPFNSFVPIGGQPSDIAASHNGKYVFTANFETEDISIIDVQTALNLNFSNTLANVSAWSLGVNGPAAKIVIEKEDKYAFVTQPTLGQLMIIKLPVFDDKNVAIEAGGPIAYLKLNTKTGMDFELNDDFEDEIQPWSMILSNNGTLFVSGKKGNYILELDASILLDTANAQYEATQKVQALGDDAIVRRIELGDFTVRSMALEPSTLNNQSEQDAIEEGERWLYAIENETGGVVVIDLREEEPTNGEMLAVNANNPLADDAYSINVPGRARSINFVTASEDSELPSPRAFNGSFGVVATTQSYLVIIDAEDKNITGNDNFTAKDNHYNFVEHSIRSGLEFYNNDDFDQPVYPKVDTEPVFVADGEYDAKNTPVFANSTGDIAGCDEGGDFRIKETSHNVLFRCDRAVSSSEYWTITWQGDVGISGKASISTNGDNLLLEDANKNFCTAGLLGPDIENGIDDNNNPTYLYDGIEGLEKYDGDLIEITSAPTPMSNEPELCSQYEDENITMIYKITHIESSKIIKIEEIKGNAPLPSKECFGQILTYKIKASNHWILTGSKTGHLRRGSVDESTNQCVPWLQDETKEEQKKRVNQRVFENVAFENHYMRFWLSGPPEEIGSSFYEDITSVQFNFLTINGFYPMSAVLSTNITDIEITPSNDLVFVDQSGGSLIYFDMINNFTVLGLDSN